MAFPQPPYLVRDLPGCILIAQPAEIDLGNAETLFHSAAATGARSSRLRLLILDLTGTRFMDSQGARLVTDVRRLLGPRTPLRVAARPDGTPSPSWN